MKHALKEFFKPTKSKILLFFILGFINFFVGIFVLAIMFNDTADADLITGSIVMVLGFLLIIPLLLYGLIAAGGMFEEISFIIPLILFFICFCIYIYILSCIFAHFFKKTKIKKSTIEFSFLRFFKITKLKIIILIVFLMLSGIALGLDRLCASTIDLCYHTFPLSIFGWIFFFIGFYPRIIYWDLSDPFNEVTFVTSIIFHILMIYLIVCILEWIFLRIYKIYKKNI